MCCIFAIWKWMYLKLLQDLLDLLWEVIGYCEQLLVASNRFAIPKFIIGMTVVSFATSLPELIVSVRSALSGYPDLALGNVVGSNIANLGLVLGSGFAVYSHTSLQKFLSVRLAHDVYCLHSFMDINSKWNYFLHSEGFLLVMLLVLILLYLLQMRDKVQSFVNG